MANIGQLLIKLGKLPDVEGWRCDVDNVMIKREDFERILRTPGVPCYTAAKTIREKWAALDFFPGLVVSKGYPLADNGDGEDVPETWRLPFFQVLNKDAALRLIEDTVPARVRDNMAAKNYYLRTGEVR